MANPNLASATSVLGNNASVTLSTNTETLLASNAASSNKLFAFDSITVANYSAATATITLTLYPNAETNTGGGFRIASTISIAANSSLVVITRAHGLCLKEAQSLYVTANTANALSITAFFKEFA